MIGHNRLALGIVLAVAIALAGAPAIRADQAPAPGSAATPVTLHLHGVDAAEAWTQLLAIVHQPTVFEPDQLFTKVFPHTLITLDADRQPFVSAYMQLADQTQTSFVGVQGRRGAVQERYKVPGGPRVVHGPFAFSASGMFYAGAIALSPNRATADPKMYLEVWCFNDPNIIVVARKFHVTEAIDDNGNSMTAGIEPMNGFIYVAQNPSVDVVFLKYPDTNPGKSIKRLSAIVTTRVQTAVKPVVIDDAVEAQPRSIALGDISVQFASCTFKNNAEVCFVIPNNKAGVPSPEASCALERAIRLFDANGNELASLTKRVIRGQTESRIFFDFRARDLDGKPTGPPVKLQLDFPGATRDIDFPIEFNNLRMNFIR